MGKKVFGSSSSTNKIVYAKLQFPCHRQTVMMLRLWTVRSLDYPHCAIKIPGYREDIDCFFLKIVPSFKPLQVWLGNYVMDERWMIEHIIFVLISHGLNIDWFCVIIFNFVFQTFEEKLISALNQTLFVSWLICGSIEVPLKSISIIKSRDKLLGWA